MGLKPSRMKARPASVCHWTLPQAGIRSPSPVPALSANAQTCEIISSSCCRHDWRTHDAFQVSLPIRFLSWRPWRKRWIVRDANALKFPMGESSEWVCVCVNLCECVCVNLCECVSEWVWKCVRSFVHLSVCVWEREREIGHVQTLYGRNFLLSTIGWFVKGSLRRFNQFSRLVKYFCFQLLRNARKWIRQKLNYQVEKKR